MKYLNMLKEAIYEENHEKTDLILYLISLEDNAKEYVAELFLFMESNPDINYGLPGPVVHFMEKYFLDGYEELLYSSVKRKPTLHTIWMINRMLNSPKLDEREKYMNLLKEIAENQNESDDIRDRANHYFEYQNNK